MLVEKVKELKELKVMAAEITAIEDTIKAEMVAAGKDEMIVDVFKVRYTAFTSNRFDSKAFSRTAHP